MRVRGSRRSMYVAVAAVLIASMIGCSLLTSLDELTGGEASAAEGGGPAGEGGIESGTESGTDGGADAEAGDGGDSGISREGCPTGKGPLPVRIDVGGGEFYCIDSTEVTREQYDVFLSSSPTNTHGRCGWNASFVPQRSWPYTADKKNNPVIGVDWCDAHAYCAWAGKELCGAITGGPLAQGSVTSNTKSSFVYACSRAGTRTYAYGNTFDGKACNDAAYNVGQTIPVGTALGCEGGFKGIFDLVGNVSEWGNACDDTAPDGGSDSGASDNCRAYNSSFAEAQDIDLKCTAARTLPRNHADTLYGFRCCASP